MRLIRGLAIHQTGGSNTETVESIRRYHMTPESQGGPPGGPWSDIGYHLVCYRDGTVHDGRPIERVGSHVKGANADTIGICCVGKGDAFPIGTSGYMTQPQWGSLLDLCEALCRRFNLRYWQVKGHREYPSGAAQGKTCPGFGVRKLRLELKERLEA